MYKKRNKKMESATRLLNLLSFFIIFLNGLYIHIVFDSVLSVAVLTLLWVIIGLYLVMQLQMNFRIYSKFLLLLGILRH